MARTTAITANPPGWRVDPTGRHRMRYWNGNTWTSVVTYSPSPAALGSSPGSDSERRQPLLAAGASAIASTPVARQTLPVSGRRVVYAPPVSGGAAATASPKATSKAKATATRGTVPGRPLKSLRVASYALLALSIGSAISVGAQQSAQARSDRGGHAVSADNSR